MPLEPTSGGEYSKELKRFNDAFNISWAIKKCTDSSHQPDQYIPAVAHLETLVINESGDKELIAFKFQNEKRLLETPMDQRKSKQYDLALDEMRWLYSRVKSKSPRKEVLAIGRPKCHKCGEPIKWNRDKKEVKDVSEPESKPEPAANPDSDKPT